MTQLPNQSKFFTDIIEQTTSNVQKIRAINKELSLLNREQEQNVKSFLIEITKDYFDFNQYPYLPINSNSFLSHIKIQQQDNSFGFYGLRYEFRGQNLVSTDKHTFISFNDWQNLPDVIKKVNFEERKNSDFNFSETPTIFVQEYRAGKTIIENKDYLLSWVKPHLSAGSELILYSKNLDKSKSVNSKKEMLNILSPLNITTLITSSRHQYSTSLAHHVIHSGGRLNKKMIDTVSSHIITIFGENGLKSIYTKLDKQQEINKNTLKIPKKDNVEQLEFDVSKLKL